mmetsp:Transcript_32175/g.32557  ORF Transcript_32175/g.32557 Transcript_32175/m.32557 type:complete len:223 (+) Transcript_32175:681-1349(+)
MSDIENINGSDEKENVEGNDEGGKKETPVGALAVIACCVGIPLFSIGLASLIVSLKSTVGRSKTEDGGGGVERDEDYYEGGFLPNIDCGYANNPPIVEWLFVMGILYMVELILQSVHICLSEKLPKWVRIFFIIPACAILAWAIVGVVRLSQWEDEDDGKDCRTMNKQVYRMAMAAAIYGIIFYVPRLTSFCYSLFCLGFAGCLMVALGLKTEDVLARIEDA